MTTLPHIGDFDKMLTSGNCIKTFLSQFRVSEKLRICNAYKTKEVPIFEIFSGLIRLAFTQTSLHQVLKSKSFGLNCEKHTIYRLLNSSSINWQRFANIFSISVLDKMFADADAVNERQRNQQTWQKTVTHAHEEMMRKVEHIKAYICDDTAIHRKRSRVLEPTAKQFDHSHRFCLCEE